MQRLLLRRALACSAVGISTLIGVGVAAGPAHATPAATCTPSSSPFSVISFDAAAGAAKVSLPSTACAPVTVSLVAYELPNGSGIFPQTQLGIDTVTLTPGGASQLLTVPLASCQSQVDLILGADAPGTLDSDYFSPHHTLVKVGHVGNTSSTCAVTTPPTTPPTSPPTTPPTSPTTTPPTNPTHSPTHTTSVLGTSNSKTPPAPVRSSSGSGVLPFTGLGLPLQLTVLIAIGLVLLGICFILGARQQRVRANR